MKNAKKFGKITLLYTTIFCAYQLSCAFVPVVTHCDTNYWITFQKNSTTITSADPKNNVVYIKNAFGIWHKTYSCVTKKIITIANTNEITMLDEIERRGKHGKNH